MKASDLAHAANGIFEGGTDPDISGAAPLDHARPTDVTLLASARYLPEAADTAAGVVLVQSDLAAELRPDLPRIIVADVHVALAALLPILYPPTAPQPGIHQTAVLEQGVSLGAAVTVAAYAVIGAGTRIDDGAFIGAHASIGRLCRIGSGAYLHPHVSLYDGVSIGARTILHSGVRIGVDGFGYAFRDGRHHKVPQVGRCMVGDDVEIGANSCVDRGSIGSTMIGHGCKIDNAVHIGHNVRIGDQCILVAQVGIAGSTRLGNYVTFGGQSGVAGHITIGDGATIAARAGVIGDVEKGATVSGYPARPHKEALRASAALFRLPELMKRLRALERAVFRSDSGSNE